MKYLLSVLLLVLFFNYSFSQCTPNTSFTAPGLYPDTLTEGTVGQAYAETVTFVMPTDTSGFDFTNFEIVSISLPAGLSWQCDNFATGCNYNPQVNIYGCIAITGTPILAGDYIVQASALADLTITSDVPVTFEVFLHINPQIINTTNNGFSLTTSGNCAPVTVNFTNNNPGLMGYTWDFGNGSTSTLENPNAQLYTNPGVYIINYEAFANTSPTDIYTLTGFTVNSLSNYGGGFPSFENADAFFIISENGNPVYTSPVIADTDPPVSWTTNIVMNQGSTYTVDVWESDAGEFGFGADDYMGNAGVSFNGCTNCAISNGVISYVVNHVVIPATPSVISADTIEIFAQPTTPDISYNSGTQTLSTTSTEPFFQWYQGNISISGATSNNYQPSVSGYYSVIAYNGGNCAAVSDSILVVICDTSFVPVITGGTGTLSVNNPAGYDVEWSLNGSVLAGLTNNSIAISTGGSYTVTLSDTFGCVYSSAPFVSTLAIAETAITFPSIYPNPTKNSINIVPQSTKAVDVKIIDVLGRPIASEKITEKTSFDLANYGRGVYLVVMEIEGKRFMQRIVVE
jgi:Secretion system C-terminal sorting domain